MQAVLVAAVGTWVSVVPHPDKEAIAFRGRRISYAELDETSTHLAAFLRSSGVETGMRVAIYSLKCADEVAAIFAIARAGGVPRPHQPGIPRRAVAAGHPGM